MTVLIVMPLAEQRGGAELALEQLVAAPGGVRWHVAFLEDGPMVQTVRAAGVGASVIPAGRLRQPHRGGLAVWRLARLARRVGADAVLSWMGKAHLYGGPAARLAGVPAVWFQMGLPDPTGRMDRLISRVPAKGILTCSMFVADAQRGLNPDTPMYPVHLAADLRRFDAGQTGGGPELRRRLGLPAGGPLVGIAGRMQRWKGMHVLVEAMPRILARHPDAHAVIVGGEWKLEPDYPAFLKSRIDDSGLADRVILAGHQGDVPAWMAACDVVVHASDREPFGMVVVEAMALGRPVVAGAEGGPREVITDGVDGLLAPFGDAPALSAAVLRYLDDPAFAAQVGVAARGRAGQFSVERYARGVTDALAEMAGRADQEER